MSAAAEAAAMTRASAADTAAAMATGASKFLWPPWLIEAQGEDNYLGC